MSAHPRLHPAAAAGFEHGAQAYDRGRPGYPAAAIELLVAQLQIGSGSTVIDLAAGTGKLTAALLPTGAEIIAVEPVAGMRQAMARTMPQVRAADGTAESLPVADDSADAVVVGQAFHWFDGPLALAEIARVLRPGGGLGIVFNVREGDDPIQAALERIWEPYRGDTPTHRGGAWRSAFDTTERFSPLLHRSFANDQRAGVEQLVDRVVSVSFIARLSTAERVEVEEQVRALVPDGGHVVLPYRTDVYCATSR